VSDNSQSPLAGESDLGKEELVKVLRDFGLTDTEAEIYLFLANQEALKGTEIAKFTKKDKAQVYHILKSLQAKGLVESTLEAPVRFAPVPFERIVDLTIKSKKDEAKKIEKAKEDLLKYWGSISKNKLDFTAEKFVVIEGRHKVYSKIAQMINETKNQFSTITTVNALVRADQFGLYDAFSKHSTSSKIQFRFLTQLSSQNLNGMKTILSELSGTGFYFRGTNPDLGRSVFSRMVIRDNEETLFFITPRTASSNEELDDVCLWTNCKSLVDSFTSVFEELWHNSKDIVEKIAEIETGTPIPKSALIEDNLIAKKKSNQDETLVVSSSKGLIESSKDMKKHVTNPKTKRLSTKKLTVLATVIVAIIVVVSVAAMPIGLFFPSNPLTTSPSPSSLLYPSPSAPVSSTSFPATHTPSSSLTPSPLATDNPSSSNSMVAKFYDNPVISADGTSISLPYSFVNDRKIVNLDLKLEIPATSVTIGGRTVTLFHYRDGNYLPLLVIITPQQHLVAALRVCEPCHTFSFSIVDGVLQCDSLCHTRWNLETFEGLSGMCADTPPPQIPASIVGNNIVVDFSQLHVRVIQ